MAVQLPMEGLRVIDFGRGYGAMPGMVLADYGADVIKIEPLGGEAWRTAAAFRQWNRGKRSVTIDLGTPVGLANALSLMRTADVVIENFRPGVMTQLGLGYEPLRSVAPRVVYLSITGFGSQSRNARIKGYEGIVAAKSGQFVIQNGYRDDGPIYDAVPKCSFGASMLGLIGILAALHARNRTGTGQRVETSLVQANFVYSYTGIRTEHAEPSGLLNQVQGRDPHNVMAGYRIAQCSDGRWIQSGSATGRIFNNLLRALDIDVSVDDPLLQGTQLLSLIDDAYRKAPLDHWCRLFDEEDVAYGTFLTTQEFMDYPQVVHNGHVIRVNDTEVGPTDQVGRLVRFHGQVWPDPTSAPPLGEHTDAVLAALGDAAASAPTPPTTPIRSALDDVVILDLSMFAAAPGGPGLLADLGARVIKIEPPTGDPLGTNAIGGNELFFRVNRGKERVTLDLKQPEGREVFHRLVSSADVVIHNFRPGVPERLGVDFPTLRRINDRIVYVYAASFGSTGPDAHRPAFDAVISAMAGGEVLQAGANNPPQQRQTTDHSALLGVATAILLGLRARDLSEQSQELETTMLASAAYLFSDDFIRYDGKPPRLVPDSGQHGLHALYRLYRAAADGWVFLACTNDEEWRCLCRGIDRLDLLEDMRFQTAETRSINDAELSAILAEEFTSRPPEGEDGWEQRLAELDVACVSATGTWQDFLFTADASGGGDQRVGCFKHPLLGEVEQVGAAINLSHTPGKLGMPQPFAASTLSVLHEVGYSQEEIRHLLEIGAAQRAVSAVEN